MSSGDKMAPFLASEMACQMIFLLNATFVKNYFTYFCSNKKDARWQKYQVQKTMGATKLFTKTL